MPFAASLSLYATAVIVSGGTPCSTQRTIAARMLCSGSRDSGGLLLDACSTEPKAFAAYPPFWEPRKHAQPW